MSSDEPQLPKQRAYRTRYEAIFSPLGQKLDKWGVSANSLSYLNVIFSVFTAVAYYLSGPSITDQKWSWLFLALILMSIASFFDMIDGSVARAFKVRNPDQADRKFGAVLDPALDRYGEAFIVLGILLSGLVPPEWILFAFVGMIMASYVRARAESLGMENCSVGIERKEKITLLGIGTGLEALFDLLIENGSNLIPMYPSYDLFGTTFFIGPLALSVAVVGILSHIATYQRLRLASKYL